jgi:hypothetical protein
MSQNASDKISRFAMARRSAGAAAWIGAVFLLGACAVGPDGSAMFAPVAEAPDDSEAAPLEARYCYHSLADVDCYTEVLPNTRRTRVGYFHESSE